MPTSGPPPDMIADAPRANWVDRYAPAAIKPYLKLARFDRPIGAWLLLFPTWWGQALAENAAGYETPNVIYLALFLIGAFVMRGAGCAWNDYVDRDYDGRVERTALRPIPSGQVSPRQALLFACFLSLIGFLVLIQFNPFTVGLGVASVALVAAYPFFKRFTHWPQIMLGLTFKWGALVGWAAIMGSLDIPPLLLYAGSVLWTIGYDTIYAHQDKADDAVVGLKSTALLLGESSGKWVGAFYTGAVLLWAAAGVLADAGIVFYPALALAAVHLGWQVVTLDIHSPDGCLKRFRSNRVVGWIIFLGLVAAMVTG
jgi:4-hydroxybenzoate polyprenyltransferase